MVQNAIIRPAVHPKICMFVLSSIEEESCSIWLASSKERPSIGIYKYRSAASPVCAMAENAGNSPPKKRAAPHILVSFF